MKNRLCPDMDNISDKLRVRGTYINTHDRISFSI